MNSRNVQRKPPTIKDVATLAGVSMSTVSRVLNGSAAVQSETAERVRRAVTQLDFVLSASARTLRPGVRSMTWGLLVDAVESHYFSTLIAELDRAAQDHGSTLLGVLHAVALEGADVEIACTEEIDAAFLSPVPLTLVAADFSLLVSNAVELLAARIDGTSTEPPVTRLLPTGQIRLDALRP